MLEAGDIDGMDDGPGDRVSVQAAYRGFPDADADHSAVRRESGELRVRQISLVVTRAAHAGVRDHHRPGGGFEDIFDGRRRSVGEVDHHPLRLHPPNPFAPQGVSPPRLAP